MKLYDGKWDPDAFRAYLEGQRRAAVIRQAQENAAELEAIDRELAAVELWVKRNTP